MTERYKYEPQTIIDWNEVFSMALPQRTPSSWIQDVEFPRRLFGRGDDDYELYEEDDEFVLTVELPGYDTDDISVTWADGVLNIGAERTDESRGQRKTYHRQFRFPKHVDDEAITAEYTNGVLELSLPVEDGATASGQEIAIQA